MHKVDLAIIGGGLVGASLALALAPIAKARRLRFALIEPFAPGNAYQPSYDARSTALSYGSRLIYEQLGCWAEIAKRAEAIHQIHISDRGRLGAARMQAAHEQVPALGYVVENAWLGHCLWQALESSGVERLCPAEAVMLKPVTEGYQISLKDSRVLECSLAVLADGGRSALREQLGIGVTHTPYQQTALIANVSPSMAHQGVAYERFTPTGPLALLPLTEQRCALVWTLPEPEAKRVQALEPRAFLNELTQAFGYRLGGFTQVGERHLYPLALVEAQEQVRPHLVVLGNAAHSLHPVAGQGYNLSLRDAYALAQVLEQSPEPLGQLPMLKAYIDRQAQDQAITVGFSDRVTRLFSNTQPVLSAGRNLGLLGLDLLPPAKSWLARQAMGLATRKW